MPSKGTSSISTREWKAIDAMIAILAAESAPPTSSVGSASAYPSCLGARERLGVAGAGRAPSR